MIEIKGYEGKYFLTENQEVFSQNTKKVLKTRITHDYSYVDLWSNNRYKRYYIHSIVAKAYPEICGEWFERCAVHHIDHNSQNNDPHNLIILTQAEHKLLHAKSELTINKLRESHIGQPAWNKGLHTKSGMEGKHHTDETKRKIRENSTVKKPVVQLSLDGIVIKQFESTIDAERELGINHSNISRCCENKPHYITAGGYKWKYLN